MADPTFDIAAANRWFAIELNNATWAWLDANTEGEPNDPIVHVAHASYHHWSQAGTAINTARAASLVANVHATLGNGELALAMAVECLTLLESAGDDAQDWDVAFGHDSLARAHAALRSPEAADQKAKARALGDAIADPQDKEIFDAWFPTGNWHGLA